MIKVEKIVTPSMQTNCYIVYREGSNLCVIIDPAEHTLRIDNKLKELLLTPVAILLTHTHLDHINGVSSYKNSNCKVYANDLDEDADVNQMIANSYGVDICPFEVDFAINDGEIIEIDNIKFEVIFTPGHTMGSVCYKCDNLLFAGDTLFYMSIGRTDFPNGSFKKINQSLKKLFKIEFNCLVYPGHGNNTSLFFERDNNPYAKF